MAPEDRTANTLNQFDGGGHAQGRRRPGHCRVQRPAAAAQLVYAARLVVPVRQSSMRLSEQAIFEQHFDAFAATRQLHPRQWRAAQCIRWCGTLAMGAHVLSCPSGAYEQLQFHACRHRSCPRCADAARSRWIDAELQRLLPCPHFHCVFTLPHQLLPLWEFNREQFVSLLMRCARQSLLELMGSPNHLGVTPGLLLSLHTWGRTLSHHPHVHCLLSAGGIDATGTWRSSRPGWLLPVRPLQALFRGKLLAAVMTGVDHHWQLPPWSTSSYWRGVVHRLYRKHWNIEIRPPYEHGRGVVLYLARYAKGGPLPRTRPLFLNHGLVQFEYTDHRDARTKLLSLSTDEFVSRVLWHAPPRGQHTTRHAGLYTSAWRAQYRLAQQQLLCSDHPNAFPLWPRPTPTSPPLAALCPHCGRSLLRTRRLLGLPLSPPPTHHLGEISPPSTKRALDSTAHPHQRGPTCRSSGPPMAWPGAAPQPSYRAAVRRQAKPLGAA